MLTYYSLHSRNGSIRSFVRSPDLGRSYMSEQSVQSVYLETQAHMLWSSRTLRAKVSGYLKGFIDYDESLTINP